MDCENCGEFTAVPAKIASRPCSRRRPPGSAAVTTTAPARNRPSTGPARHRPVTGTGPDRLCSGRTYLAVPTGEYSYRVLPPCKYLLRLRVRLLADLLAKHLQRSAHRRVQYTAASSPCRLSAHSEYPASTRRVRCTSAAMPRSDRRQHQL